MVRHYTKKSDRCIYGNENLSRALEAIAQGRSVNGVSKEYKIPCRTLSRHRDKKVRQPGTVNLGRHVQVLPPHIEQELHDHIKCMERSMYGLCVKDVRKLAFEIAETYKLKHPFNTVTKCAGKDWLSGFFRRYPDLSIRIPQGTNLSRAIGFNKPKVERFFTLYKNIREEHAFLPSQIWNMDETGITNVHKPCRVVASKGSKQVSKITSGERGSTVTVICAMSSAGVYLPPMLIFPRKRMADSLMMGAPPQSIGCCSSSGWTDSSLFVTWLEHFVKFTNSSSTAPHIIIMDGHHSHKSLAAILFAREHGIHLITLPPHSTHKMQPLDRTYFKSLKSAYNSAADSWMVSNPGKRITFANMAAIFGQAFTRSATPEKAIHGFEICGLQPYNANIFTDDEFDAARVTEEEEPAKQNPPIADIQPSTSQSTADAQPSTSQSTADAQPSTSQSTAEDQPSTSQSTADAQPSTSQSTAEDQPSTSQSTAEDRPSTSQSNVDAQPSTSQSIAEDQPSISQSTAEAQPSASQSNANEKSPKQISSPLGW